MKEVFIVLWLCSSGWKHVVYVIFFTCQTRLQVGYPRVPTPLQDSSLMGEQLCPRVKCILSWRTRSVLLQARKKDVLCSVKDWWLLFKSGHGTNWLRLGNSSWRSISNEPLLVTFHSNLDLCPSLHFLTFFKERCSVHLFNTSDGSTSWCSRTLRFTSCARVLHQDPWQNVTKRSREQEHVCIHTQSFARASMTVLASCAGDSGGGCSGCRTVRRADSISRTACSIFVHELACRTSLHRRNQFTLTESEQPPAPPGDKKIGFTQSKWPGLFLQLVKHWLSFWWRDGEEDSFNF